MKNNLALFGGKKLVILGKTIFINRKGRIGQRLKSCQIGDVIRYLGENQGFNGGKYVNLFERQCEIL